MTETEYYNEQEILISNYKKAVETGNKKAIKEAKIARHKFHDSKEVAELAKESTQAIRNKVEENMKRFK